MSNRRKICTFISPYDIVSFHGHETRIIANGRHSIGIDAGRIFEALASFKMVRPLSRMASEIEICERYVARRRPHAILHGCEKQSSAGFLYSATPSAAGEWSATFGGSRSSSSAHQYYGSLRQAAAPKQPSVRRLWARMGGGVYAAARVRSHQRIRRPISPQCRGCLSGLSFHQGGPAPAQNGVRAP